MTSAYERMATPHARPQMPAPTTMTLSLGVFCSSTMLAGVRTDCEASLSELRVETGQDEAGF